MSQQMKEGSDVNLALPYKLDYEPVNGFQVPLDMSDLMKYEAMIDEVTKVNNITGPFYMQEFLKAINVASSFYSRALWQYEQALVVSKATRARLMLDEASKALVEKGLRVNETNMLAYAEMHPEYLTAKENESYYLALSEFLKQKFEKFQRAHDDARKIFERLRDVGGSGQALPSGRDT